MAFAAVLRDFGIEHKILSVTCDNTSNNDTMVEKMDGLLTTFLAVNRTRCFNHILNLVAKSLLKQFDVHRTDKEASDLDDDERSLLGLAGDIDEELTMEQEDDSEDGGIEEDDLEDWVDEIAALTPEERKDLEALIHPVKCTLVKLRKLAFKIIHSTTLLLPAWKESLELLKLVIRIMPRDVSTRWNSTYDMLDFAIRYQKAIKSITSDRKNDLRQFEMSEEEWAIADELREVLKVRLTFIT